MSSIRPLATITILAVVGVILYVKINQGPTHHGPAAGQEWQSQPPVSVPPLDTMAPGESAVFRTAPSTAGGTAPAWTGSTTVESSPPAVSPMGSSTSGVTAQNDAGNLPAVPDIPELPPLQGETQPPAAALPPVTSLPADIPTAQYSGASTDASLPAPPGSVSGRVPSLGTATPDITTGAASPAASTPEVPPYGALANPLAAAGTVPPPAVTGGPAPIEPSSTTSTVPSSTEADRYGAVSSAAADDSSFAAAWPVIQAALERQELARAHLLLSQWYGDPSLSPAEAQQVETLLSQLAGTVVYSTEHRLEPAYVVRPGETLQTIAKQYNVPWQLLGKINGISAADQVRPGQQLKVIRGPFSAVVELSKRQLTLMLDGRYAGKFPIQVDPTAAVSEGQWLVDQKLAVPADNSRYGAAPTSTDRALVLRSGEPVGPGATLLVASSGGPTAGQPTGSSPAIRVSPRDAEELSDILSVGSRVVIRR